MSSDNDRCFQCQEISHMAQYCPHIQCYAHITDCSTVTIHAGKHYQALIDSGAAISLLRHSTYKQIKDCFKTPIQPTAAKLNTADGSPMTTLGSTALHL